MTPSDCRADTTDRLARADLALIEAGETIVYLLAATRHTPLADEAERRAMGALDTIRGVLPSGKSGKLPAIKKTAIVCG